MSESEWSLLGFLAAIYVLSGCLWWIRREAVGFRALLWGAQRFVPGNALLGNEQGGLLWLNPLPPFGTTYVAQCLPVSLSEEGVLSFASQSQPPAERYPTPDARCLAWSEVVEIAVADHDVLVGGRRFARLGSSELAAH
jgi:hypothetical protein